MQSSAFKKPGRFFGIIVLFISFTSYKLYSQTTYKVGDGQSYTSIGAVPWENLVAGDSVKIYWRSAPYKEKWVINRQGQADKWITVTGVPNSSSQLPVIDGQDAITRIQLNYWGEERGIIKIGGSNTPADGMPCYIRVENLEIKNARSNFSFTGRSGIQFYNSNASAVYLEKGENIEIRNCILTNCGNGFFSAYDSKNVLVESCYIFNNGNAGSIYEHNSYTESKNIVFQYNHFGPLLPGSNGNNLKDRSAGTVIRFNWIEGGNRQLDLVDSEYPEVFNLPEYSSTYVYGNILIEPDGAGNNQICHYGGDSGTETAYRKGILYFFNNTVISTRSSTTTLLRLSTDSETANCFNNIIYVTATGSNLAMLEVYGVMNLQNNWIKDGWVSSHEEFSGTLNNLGNNISGTSPGFVSVPSQNYSLLQESECIDKGKIVPAGYPVNFEYVRHQQHKTRDISGPIDLGAYEYSAATLVGSIAAEDLQIFPNPAHEKVFIKCPVLILKISIFTLAGQIYSEIISPGYDTVLDLKNFKRGLYLLKIKTDSGIITRKLVVN